MIPEPDKLYACVGKGIKGAVIEFRHGLEASVGVELEHQTLVIQAWAVSSPAEDSTDQEGTGLLLCLGDRTAFLQLSSDAMAFSDVPQEKTRFDLGHRTIAANVHEQCKIQVTELSIIIITGSYL